MLAEKEGLIEHFKLYSSVSLNNMHLFDANNRIKKYSSPLQVIDEFYDIRMDFYEKRKKWLLEVMTKDLLVLDNQARFYNMVVSGELSVVNQKKDALLAKLKALGFANMMAEASNKEESQEGSELSGLAGYGYLLKAPLWNLTEEKIGQLHDKFEKRKKEQAQLLSKQPADMWKDEIQELGDHWEGIMQQESKKKKKEQPV